MTKGEAHRMYPVHTPGLPPERRNVCKYPWASLDKAGKAFDVPIDDPAYFSIRNTAKNRQRRAGQRYSCRIVYDEKTRVAKAIRVTRLDDRPK